METLRERVKFRLIKMPCCEHLLCWANARYPTYCPECGTRVFNTVEQCVMVPDENAMLEFHQ